MMRMKIKYNKYYLSLRKTINYIIKIMTQKNTESRNH